MKVKIPAKPVKTIVEALGLDGALQHLADTKSTVKYDDRRIETIKAEASCAYFAERNAKGTTDWSKQDAIKTGAANVQLPSQTHGKNNR